MNLIRKTRFLILAFGLFSITVTAQSTEQNFPTAVAANEINGTIRARDIGDSRLTSFFYAFDGGQGDIFINAVTKNFTGDIDVFIADGLRPLTKMVIYADAGDSETGRLVYLRKPERLILRIEGRSPNDDPATFRIKFAGSFIALAEKTQQETPTVARRDNESGVRVNSVGTIVEVVPKTQPSPKATPEPKEAVAAVTKPKRTTATKTVTKVPPISIAAAKPPVAKPPGKPKENIPTKPPHETVATAPIPTEQPPKKETSEVKTVFQKPAKPKVEKPATKTSKPPTEPKPDPMAGIRLVVQFKDGNVVERPMTEVTKFIVDKGILTVTAKDGTTVKYSMLDVAKVTIE